MDWDNFVEVWWKLGYVVNDNWWWCGDCGGDGPGFHACQAGWT